MTRPITKVSDKALEALVMGKRRPLRAQITPRRGLGHPVPAEISWGRYADVGGCFCAAGVASSTSFRTCLSALTGAIFSLRAHVWNPARRQRALIGFLVLHSPVKRLVQILGLNAVDDEAQYLARGEPTSCNPELGTLAVRRLSPKSSSLNRRY